MPFDDLTGHKYISLTTFRRDGRPVATPVQFVRDGDRLLVNTGARYHLPMPDMLVRLYALPDGASYDARCAAAGITVRRMEAWDRFALKRFILRHFHEAWAAEADFAFAGGHPIRGFVAVKDGEIAGFAVYDCSRRGYFGPTGVREDLRASGAGAVLLFRCLEAMRDIGYGYAIIGWVGPTEFYERVVGATIIEGSDPGVYGAARDEIWARARASEDSR